MEQFLLRNGWDADSIRRADDGRNCLAKALLPALRPGRQCLTVITTKQKLDRLPKVGTKVAQGSLAAVLGRGRVAVVCEECHRAHFQDGATFAAVSRLFGTWGFWAGVGNSKVPRGCSLHPCIRKPTEVYPKLLNP